MGRAAGRRYRWSWRDVQLVDAVWAAFALAMLGAMLLLPDDQTIPYHLVYVSFTLLYGFRLWSARVTITALTLMTLVPGAVFLQLFLRERLDASELAEIPLMALIVGGMAWHAHRSASAQRMAEDLAALQSVRSEQQREFLRDTAHAIRTPITIARGHVELVLATGAGPQPTADLAEVMHQLDRLHAMARRLLDIEALRSSSGPAGHGRVDVVQLVADVGRRWTAAVPRRWVVDSPHGALSRVQALVDPARLEEALDALVENALRFTVPGGTVRLSCRATETEVALEVADSGPGIPAEDRARVFERFFHRHPPGEEPGTGLGLALVCALAEAFGGSASAHDAPEGGALVRLTLPRH